MLGISRDAFEGNAMIDVTALFLLFSGIVFFGYILNMLFYKIKIIVVIPLMLIGLFIGPVLHLINTTQNSFVVEISSYVSSVAIAFILFEVGLGIRLSDLDAPKVLKFMFSVTIVTAIMMSLGIFLAFRWSPIYSLIAGFVIAGPSSIVAAVVTRLSKAGKRMKSALIFEAVSNDSVQLLIPLILLSLLQSVSSSSLGGLNGYIILIFDFFVVSAVFGVLSALFWTFILNYFKKYSSQYSWMLTITTVIATYGLANYLGLNGAIATFAFSVFFANMAGISEKLSVYTKSIRPQFKHIQSYQREITFFVSTFFFVYIGLLVSLSQITILMILAGITLTVMMIVIRKIFVRMLDPFISDKKHAESERTLATFDIGKGLSAVVIATIVISLPAYLNAPPNFLELIFVILLLTNILQTFGMYLYAERLKKESIVEEFSKKNGEEAIAGKWHPV